MQRSIHHKHQLISTKSREPKKAVALPQAEYPACKTPQLQLANP
ncbi:hypothetical protein [Leptolyngbya sp. UWPOB_LEPTO1]|nr:hypothetical protein [Leptolyngbya sp. UWPOB_LEPTO1]